MPTLLSRAFRPLSPPSLRPTSPSGHRTRRVYSIHHSPSDASAPSRLRPLLRDRTTYETKSQGRCAPNVLEAGRSAHAPLEGLPPPHSSKSQAHLTFSAPHSESADSPPSQPAFHLHRQGRFPDVMKLGRVHLQAAGVQGLAGKVQTLFQVRRPAGLDEIQVAALIGPIDFIA